MPDEVLADMRRIETIWREVRARYGGGGPFLFGAFGAADAMYAPVVARFHNYGLPIATDTRAYMDAVTALPAWKAWVAAAMQETWIMRHNEPDWPLVRGVKVE
jgi:glutathione S-transferase